MTLDLELREFTYSHMSMYIGIHGLVYVRYMPLYVKHVKA